MINVADAKRVAFALLLAAAAVATGHRTALASGETVTVTTLEDDVDFGGAQTAADLPGPDGVVSFREACTAANNTSGPQTIEFAIPQNEWWLYSDRAILRLESGTFVLTDNGTTIDFTTQTAFTGDTNPNGWEVGGYGLQPNGWGGAFIWIGADNCTVMGLDRVMQRGYGVEIAGNNNRVIGCTISGPLYAGVSIRGQWQGPPATGNVVGGTAPGEGNFLSAGNAGVRIEGWADDNIVIGNTLTGAAYGVWIIGSQYSVAPTNNRVGGPTPAERNVINGAGYFGEHSARIGAQVMVEWTDGTVLENNYVGITADGLSAASQIAAIGIAVKDAWNTIVRDNVVGGIPGTGIQVYSVNEMPDNNQLYGNLVGTDATGSAPISNVTGVRVNSFTALNLPLSTIIGGPNAGEGNTIAFNTGDGVVVFTLINHATISGNSIRDNAGAGISLFSPANGDQPAPMLTDASATTSSVTIDGLFDGSANAVHTIEFFANAACDPSGFGEGERFLGGIDVVTDATGRAPFSATLDASVSAGEVLTATATEEATGNTSEFSACIAVTSAGDPCDFDGDGDVDLADFSVFTQCLGGAFNPPAPTCPAGVQADLDNDGDVDAADFATLTQNFTGAR